MAESESGQSQDTGLKKLSPNSFLEIIWRDARNDASPIRQTYFAGAIEALKMCGMLNQLEAEGWIARFRTCPGHDDEGGRVWCAYCGNLNAPKAT